MKTQTIKTFDVLSMTGGVVTVENHSENGAVKSSKAANSRKAVKANKEAAITTNAAIVPAAKKTTALAVTPKNQKELLALRAVKNIDELKSIPNMRIEQVYPQMIDGVRHMFIIFSREESYTNGKGEPRTRRVSETVRISEKHEVSVIGDKGNVRQQVKHLVYADSLGKFDGVSFTDKLEPLAISAEVDRLMQRTTRATPVVVTVDSTITPAQPTTDTPSQEYPKNVAFVPVEENAQLAANERKMLN